MSEVGKSVSVTLKGPGQYEDSWIVLYADGPQEAAQLVAAATGLDQATAALRSLSDVVAEAQTVFKGQVNAAKGFAGPVQHATGASEQAVTAPQTPNVVPFPMLTPQAPQVPAQVLPQQAPAQPGMACQHGPRTYRNGQGRTGPWAAWFCPLPKGTPGQCDPSWVDQ